MTGTRTLHDDSPLLRAAHLTRAEREIIDLVRRHAGLSRAEIAARLHLSPAFLTKAVAHFRALGLVEEEREAPRRSRGQPARRLALRARAVCGLGLSLTPSDATVAAMDLTGDPLGHVRLPAPVADPEAAVTLLAPHLHRLARQAERVTGLGIIVPALQRRDGEIVEVTPAMRVIDFPRWQHVLAERLGIPVWLESRAVALNEALRQTDRDAVIFVLLLDYGVGGALIDGTRVFRGGHGHAANIGALVPESGPRPSLQDLARHLELPIAELTPDALAARHAAGDPMLGAWIASRGHALSRPLSAVVQLINPTDIVVGGVFPRGIVEALIAQVDLSLYDFPGRAPLPKPAIGVANATGAAAMAQAAAAVPLFRAFVSGDG